MVIVDMCKEANVVDLFSFFVVVYFKAMQFYGFFVLKKLVNFFKEKTKQTCETYGNHHWFPKKTWKVSWH